MALLQVQVTEKRFARGAVGQTVLSHIDLQVNCGEVLCIYGRSGCGKSTLLRIAAGLDDEYTGHVTLGGASVSRPIRDIGFTVQGDTTFEWLSVRDNILWPLRLGPERNGVNSGHADPEKLAEIVGLTADDLSKYPHEISAGMKQRVVLARALAAQPRVLLLDEPFSSLDYESRIALQALILEIRLRANVAFVCVTHDPEEALYLADRVVVLGGTPATIMQHVNGLTEVARRPELRASTEFQERIAHLRSMLKSSDEPK